MRALPAILFIVLATMSCGSPTGCVACSANDASHPISIGGDQLAEQPDLSELDSVGQEQVLSLVDRFAVIVGFVHDHSCFTKPTHESDLRVFYTTPREQPGYPPVSDLTIAGDTATVTLSYDFPQAQAGQVSALTAVGEFSVDAAQAAVDQRYPHNKPGKFLTVPEGQGLSVPISWHISGEIGAHEASFEADLVQTAKLGGGGFWPYS